LHWEHCLRELPRDEPLADPGGTDEQVGVRRPSAPRRAAEHRHLIVMSAEIVPEHGEE
jgi:hypothetical protein